MAVRAIALTNSGMILISKGEDAPVIMGISKPAGLKSPHGEVKIVNPLFVGIDVSSKDNVAYLMKPDGSKHSNFSVQNNLGGAKPVSYTHLHTVSFLFPPWPPCKHQRRTHTVLGWNRYWKTPFHGGYAVPWQRGSEHSLSLIHIL